MKLAQIEHGSAHIYDLESEEYKALMDIADQLYDCSLAMCQVGASGTWWQLAFSTPIKPLVDDMSYQCDAKLGNPREVDCSQLEYSQLGPLSDSISIRPGAPKILSSSKYG